MSPFLKNILLFLLPLFLVYSRATAQAAPMDNIGTALRRGDVGGISRYFGNTVDITINNSQSTYSRAQGEIVLRDFFNKNAPRDFEMEHTNGGGNGLFAIGSLATASGKFRVYISLKQKDGSYTLREIRFEK